MPRSDDPYIFTSGSPSTASSDEGVEDPAGQQHARQPIESATCKRDIAKQTERNDSCEPPLLSDGEIDCSSPRLYYTCDACIFCNDVCENESCGKCSAHYCTDNYCRRCHKPQPIDAHPCRFLPQVDKDWKQYTRCQVQRHNTKDDCWFIAHSSVYNGTPILDIHPSSHRLVAKAGQDCTTDFDYHSASQKLIWEQFKVGKLRECRNPRFATERRRMTLLQLIARWKYS